MPAPNPFVSSSKPTDSSLHAALHPLVLLTISDYVTRHSLRNLKTPVVGALLGQQNGREITIEHAYDVKLLPSSNSNDTGSQTSSAGTWVLDNTFFSERLTQYKDVHKQPPLELIGWWTLGPVTGPQPEMLKIHEHIMSQYNESSLLVLFHTEEMLDKAAGSGKLPLTIYETVYESKKSGEGEEDKMDVEGAEGERLEMKFREMAYEIATGEAEMIAMDFVAKGAGNAAADETPEREAATSSQSSTAQQESRKGDRGKGKEVKGPKKTVTLSADEEDFISFLTTRSNAVKVLRSRLELLQNYLQDLPPSYLTDSSLATTFPPSSEESSSTTSSASPYQIPRAILALTAKLPLLVPPTNSSISLRDAERSDAALVSLLSEMGASIKKSKELGSSFATVDGARRSMRGMMSHSGQPRMDFDPMAFDMGKPRLGGKGKGVRVPGMMEELEGDEDVLMEGR